MGMQAFLKSKEWAEMNVGFALDEGLANPTDEFTVFFGERMLRCNLNKKYILNNIKINFFDYILGVKVSCPGNPGHGSRFIEGTAAEKLRRVINRFLDYRQEEKNRLEANPKLTLGDVTSINLTRLEVNILNLTAKEVLNFEII